MYRCLDAYKSFITKTPRSSSKQLNMGYLSWGKWMCFAENCDLWSILDSLNKAIHLSIILPYVNVIVFSPSRCHVYKYNSFYLYSLFSSVLRHLQHLVLTITRTWSSLNGLYTLQYKYYWFLIGQLTCNSVEGQWWFLPILFEFWKKKKTPRNKFDRE